jgi:hypothetical protein
MQNTRSYPNGFNSNNSLNRLTDREKKLLHRQRVKFWQTMQLNNWKFKQPSFMFLFF